MRYMLPTQHVLYFGLQAKKGKLDAASNSRGSNASIAEIHNPYEAPGCQTQEAP